MACTFFAHKECEYYPCHEIKEGEELNCLFCFCPLFHFRECGGDYDMLPGGIKDCSPCKRPHAKEWYDEMVRRLKMELPNDAGS